MRNNSGIPKKTTKKHWQRHVKTWFHHPFAVARRAASRKEKAEQLQKRPLYWFRPVVSCLTAKHSGQFRLGLGFTLEELKAAGLTVTDAKKFRIRVDKRRKDRNRETLEKNRDRLLMFKDALIVKTPSIMKKISDDEKKRLNEKFAECEQIKTRAIIPFDTGRKVKKADVETVNLEEVEKIREENKDKFGLIEQFRAEKEQKRVAKKEKLKKKTK